jgi:hypothetical protein
MARFAISIKSSDIFLDMRRYLRSVIFRKSAVRFQEKAELLVPGRPSDEEALRMVVAFYCIMEPEKRAQLIELAEMYANQSQVVDGCTHFSLLDRDGKALSGDNNSIHSPVPIRKPEPS